MVLTLIIDNGTRVIRMNWSELSIMGENTRVDPCEGRVANQYNMIFMLLITSTSYIYVSSLNKISPLSSVDADVRANKACTRANTSQQMHAHVPKLVTKNGNSETLAAVQGYMQGR